MPIFVQRAHPSVATVAISDRENEAAMSYQPRAARSAPFGYDALKLRRHCGHSGHSVSRRR
jgi:hypothetical protein